jgi:hypothetical protein
VALGEAFAYSAVIRAIGIANKSIRKNSAVIFQGVRTVFDIGIFVIGYLFLILSLQSFWI